MEIKTFWNVDVVYYDRERETKDSLVKSFTDREEAISFFSEALRHGAVSGDVAELACNRRAKPWGITNAAVNGLG